MPHVTIITWGIHFRLLSVWSVICCIFNFWTVLSARIRTLHISMHSKCTQNIKYLVRKYAIWDTSFAYAWLVGLVTECVTVQLQQSSLTMQFLTTIKVYGPATDTCHCIVHFSIQKHGWITEILSLTSRRSIFKNTYLMTFQLVGVLLDDSASFDKMKLGVTVRV